MSHSTTRPPLSSRTGIALLAYLGCASCAAHQLASAGPVAILDQADIAIIEESVAHALKGATGKALVLSLSAKPWGVDCSKDFCDLGEAPDLPMCEASEALCARSSSSLSLTGLRHSNVAIGPPLPVVEFWRAARKAHRSAASRIVERTLPGYDRSRTRALTIVTTWLPLGRQCSLTGSSQLLIFTSQLGRWQLDNASRPVERSVHPPGCEDQPAKDPAR